MYHVLVEPFTYEFMQRALIAALLAGVVCSVIGAYVVLKGLGFMGDAVAHSSLAGMAAAFALGGNILLGALAWVVPASLAISFVSNRTKLLVDTSIGIIYATSFSIGIIIISRGSRYAPDLLSFLFGNVLGASWMDVVVVAIIAGAVLGIVGLLFKELLFVSYDATMAAASGVPVRLISYLLPLLIGITSVAAVKTVGIVLVLALLVTPAATARLVARRLPGIMLVGSLLACLSVVGGLYLAFHLDLPPGPAVVLLSSSLFVLVLLFGSRGLVRHPVASAGEPVPLQPAGQ